MWWTESKYINECYVLHKITNLLCELNVYMYIETITNYNNIYHLIYFLNKITNTTKPTYLEMFKNTEVPRSITILTRHKCDYHRLKALGNWATFSTNIESGCRYQCMTRLKEVEQKFTVHLYLIFYRDQNHWELLFNNRTEM